MPSELVRPAHSIRSYVKIARIDHWFKNIFMVPGVAFALAFSPNPFTAGVLVAIISALISTCLIASANYTINEWLDAEFDREHPTKKNRPAAVGNLSGRLVWLQWFLLAAAGLALAATINVLFLVAAATLLIMGIVYNVSPVRTKDRTYLDVISESFNNPLRFMLGWSSVISTTLPPSSSIIAYWMGGAFLMAIKRFAEYRFINDPERAARYRRSFATYTEESLLLSALFYAMTSCLFLGIFLIKYRIEFILLFPLVSVLFVWYFQIGLKENSVVQQPEKLYKHKGFMGFVAFFGLVMILLFFIDLPWLSIFEDYHVLSGG